MWPQANNDYSKRNSTSHSDPEPKGRHLWNTQVTWLWWNILAFCFYLHFKPLSNFVELLVVAFHVNLPCTNPTDVESFCWMTYCFGKNDPSPLWSGLSGTFPPPGLFLVPLSCALAVFHQWQSFVPLLRFRSLKIKHENHRVRGDGAARGPRANWQLGVRVSLSSPLSRTLAFFFFFSRHSSYLSAHPPLEGKAEHLRMSGTWEWRGSNLRADWKLSKLTIPCKIAQSIQSNTRT